MDLNNVRPDGSCTVAARIWLSAELWTCWILANFHVPRGISSFRMTTSQICLDFSFKGYFCFTSHLCCSLRESRYSSRHLLQTRSRCWIPFNQFRSRTLPDPSFGSKGRGSVQWRDEGLLLMEKKFDGVIGKREFNSLQLYARGLELSTFSTSKRMTSNCCLVRRSIPKTLVKVIFTIQIKLS